MAVLGHVKKHPAPNLSATTTTSDVVEATDFFQGNIYSSADPGTQSNDQFWFSNDGTNVLLNVQISGTIYSVELAS